MSNSAIPDRQNVRTTRNMNSVSDTCIILQAGTTPLRGYTLVQLRGRGGFAEVWEAVDDLGNRLALKFMSTQHMSATARELRALRQLHTLEHPHLLKSQQVWSIAGYVVIGMELAEATLLDLFLLYADDLKEKLDPCVILKYLYHAAQGLDFLNARKHTFDGRLVSFQHSDIKPNNIMIQGDVAKLADYGLATPLSGPSTPCPRHGTLDYMAPEVFKGNLTETSDQYSLAISYCLLRMGEFPFPQMSLKQSSRSVNRDQPNLNGYTIAEKLVILKALSPVPQNRYPRCVNFIRALVQALGLPELPPETEIPKPKTDPNLIPIKPSSTKVYRAADTERKL